MSPSRRRSPLAAAAAVAVFVLSLQLLSTLITPLGDAIRRLPVVPAALILVTLLVGVRLIRSR
ncbi:MAG: hypothetical protein ACKO4O_04155 [Candidatus Limnocylindrus sp.]|jgi:uncharacterized membrane protein